MIITFLLCKGHALVSDEKTNTNWQKMGDGSKLMNSQMNRGVCVCVCVCGERETETEEKGNGNIYIDMWQQLQLLMSLE